MRVCCGPKCVPQAPAARTTARRGVAEIEFKEPVNEDTVFRIGSVTKTLTAIAVVQLCEEGLVDLDAPANDSLRSLRMAIATRIAAASLADPVWGPQVSTVLATGPAVLTAPLTEPDSRSQRPWDRCARGMPVARSLGACRSQAPAALR